MRKVLVVACALGLAALSTAPAVAHHGLAKQFDMEKRVVIKGKITKVYWQNPHIYYTVDVMEKGKVRTYNIESVPVGMARAGGLTAAKLRGNGQDVEITIRPALKDPNLGFSIYHKYSDGSIITFEGFRE